jgi:outer membrane receptor for ferrienterochelin and colicin
LSGQTPSPRPLKIIKVRGAVLFGFLSLFSYQARAAQPSSELKNLNLEQLGNIEVTTASKEPEEVWKTPAAIFVLTKEDIRRSGATSIPEVLRLVPGVRVSRGVSNTWAMAIRGSGSSFSKSVLVLIDGRSVYTALFAGVDARLGWRFANFDLSLVGQNLFVPRHAEFGTGVLIERAAYGKVTWSQ